MISAIATWPAQSQRPPKSLASSRQKSACDFEIQVDCRVDHVGGSNKMTHVLRSTEYFLFKKRWTGFCSSSETFFMADVGSHFFIWINMSLEECFNLC